MVIETFEELLAAEIERGGNGKLPHSRSNDGPIEIGRLWLCVVDRDRTRWRRQGTFTDR